MRRKTTLHWKGAAERETCLQVYLRPTASSVTWVLWPIASSVTWVCVSGLSIPICTLSTTKDVVTSPSRDCY